MPFNQFDIDAMVIDSPIKDEKTGYSYVKKFIRDAEVPVKVRHNLGKKPTICEIVWSSQPVLHFMETNDDGTTKCTKTDSFITFFESKVTVLLRFG